MLEEAKNTCLDCMKGRAVSLSASSKSILATVLEAMLRHLEQEDLNDCNIS